jgi:hypothetical protein
VGPQYLCPQTHKPHPVFQEREVEREAEAEAGVITELEVWWTACLLGCSAPASRVESPTVVAVNDTSPPCGLRGSAAR